MTSDSTKIFTTEKAADVLGIPKWRVVRFAQLKAYGIEPAYGQAEGPGSRRLYSLENLCELGLAWWLLQSGLRAKVIGRVLKQLRKQGGLTPYLSENPEKLKRLYLGVIRIPNGETPSQDVFYFETVDDLSEIFRQQSDASLVVVPIGLRLLWLTNRASQGTTKAG